MSTLFDLMKTKDPSASLMESLSAMGAPKTQNYSLGNFNEAPIANQNSFNYGLPAAPGYNGLNLGDQGGYGMSAPANSTFGNLAPNVGGGDWMSTLGSWGKGIGDFTKSIGLTGSTDKDGMKTDGWGGTALGVLGALQNMKSYNLNVDAYNTNKANTARSFDNAAKVTNNQLAERQNMRVQEAAANGRSGSVASIADYMKQWGVS